MQKMENELAVERERKVKIAEEIASFKEKSIMLME